MTRSRQRLVALVASVLLATLGLPGSVPTASAASPFTDIGNSIFKSDIEWLWAEGITTGCTPTTYCPDNQVYRDEMASFLSRMFDLPPTSSDYFVDDESNIHQDDINRVAEAGITVGCKQAYYCPHGIVRRDHMAAFISRAVPLTVGDGRNYFRDENASAFEVHIDRAAAAGIANGCLKWRYCPGGKYTRGQMAAFLHRVVAPLPALPYPAPGGGLIFYVATTGTDGGNDCLTPATPCRTVKSAIDQTIDGDTIQIGPGTYAEPPLSVSHGVDFIGDGAGGTTIDVASNAASALTVTGYGLVNIDHVNFRTGGGGIRNDWGLDLSVVGSTITGTCAMCYGIVTEGRLTLADSTISGYADGIDAWGVTITNSSITGNAGVGVRSRTSDSPRSSSITNSTISGNGDAGLDLNVSGTLTLTDSTVSGNGGAGLSLGGPYGEGTYTVTDSTISGNGGAGLDLHSYIGAATFLIVDSTINANGASGVLISAGHATIANSTISGNAQPGATGGGGILTYVASTNVVNSTITANTSGGAGGGINNKNLSGPVLLTNTIVAGNTLLATGAASEVVGLRTVVASSIGVPMGLTLADILSGGLADHGGPTKTIALTDSATNPALDTGDAATCAADPVNGVDQRGLPRTPPCDIGAYELQP